MSNENPSNVVLDVAIIGGGASGLYSAWRLKENDPSLNVTVFELSDRTGGRLYTVQDFAGTGFHAELGGMRYLVHQKMVAELVKKFKLQTTEFPTVDQPDNFYNIRQQKFKLDNWGDTGMAPPYFPSKYAYSKEGKLLTADEIFGKLTDQILKENGHKTRPQDRKGWDDIKSTLKCYQGPDKGEFLENIGFWNLLEGMAGSEAYEICAQAGGYYSNTINWNAAEALPYIVGDFGGTIEYKTLVNGMEAIPNAIEQAFLSAGGVIEMNHRLTSFTIDGTVAKYKLNFDVNDGVKTPNIYAKKIIFGMPRRSLELFEWPKNLWSDLDFRMNVMSVIGDPAFKLLMAFDYDTETETGPWWEKLGIKGGRSLTDLPMRQCYYFETNREIGRSILLSTYNDMRTVSFWQTLEKPGEGLFRFTDLLKTPGLRNGVGAVDGVRSKLESRRFQLPKSLELPGNHAEIPQAPARMVRHAIDQLKKLHETNEIPDPVYTSYMNWAHDPYGGGYHAWKANYHVGDVMQYMRRPWKDQEIHIVGEAYSDQQGWVEGAFCIAEQMLQENFGLKWPSWLPTDYYLGR